MKALSLMCGALLVILGVLSFVLFNVVDPINFILTIYYFIFGAFIIGTELKLMFIVKNFFFINSFTGRGIFYIFVGTLCLQDSILFYIVAGILIVMGIAYLVCACFVKRAEVPDDKQGTREALI